MIEKEKEDSLKMLIEKVEKLEKEFEEIKKRQQILQDAIYKIYEDQRRRERSL